MAAEVEVASYLDTVSGALIVVTELSTRWAGRDHGFRRLFRMVYYGMLLQVQIRIINPMEILVANGAAGSEYERCAREFPDLAYMYGLMEFPPYDEAKLRSCMKGFASTVIPKLNLEKESVDYIWENLEEVTDFLVSKLTKDHLRFYKRMIGKGPEDYASIVFGDFCAPEAPTFLYPAFGLKAVTFGIGYVPWIPCHKRKGWSPVVPQQQNEAEEADQPAAGASHN